MNRVDAWCRAPCPLESAHDHDRAERRLIEHVDRIEAEQPPIALESVDYTVLRPDVVRERFGPMLDYLARVELEVDRNVLELNTMLPNPPEIDVRFYREVWHAQEIQHGVILDRLQTIIGRPPASPGHRHRLRQDAHPRRPRRTSRRCRTSSGCSTT